MVFFSRQSAPLTEREWIQRQPSRLDVARYAFWRFYYRIIPDSLGARFTLGSAFRLLTQYGLVAAIAFTPIVFAHWVAPLLGLPTTAVAALTSIAVYQTAVIAVAQLLKYVVDALGGRNEDKRERLQSLVEISVALRQVIGLMRQQIISVATTPAAEAQRDGVLSHALKCIEETVKLCMGHLQERYCCVTLLTFEANDRVKIRSRSNMAGRPVGGDYDQNATIAYSVAKHAPQSFAIYHFKKMANVRKQNPLAYQALSIPQKPPYESVLALPLPATKIQGQNQDMRKGVVMIDTARPYEFLGKDTDILNRVQAYLDLINLMLVSHDVGVKPEI